MPPPRRRMTVPSKTWMRSRVPSTTLADTRTVSPDASGGRSVRIWSATMSSRTVMSGLLSLAGGLSGGAHARGGAAAPVGRSRSISGPPAATGPGASAGSVPGPAPAATARPRRGARSAARRGRTTPRNSAGRVNWGYSRSPVEKDSSAGRCVVDDPWQQPQDGIDDDQRRDLPARQDVVADGQLEVDHRAHAVVDAFVARADKHEVLRRRQLDGTAPGRTDGHPGRAGCGRPTTPAGARASSAAATGSGRSSMPAPPP